MSQTTSKRTLLISLITLVTLFSLFYWIYGNFIVSTDDAYVNANVVQIAPRVTGQVLHLYVSNNQYVKAGQPLFDLDPVTYQADVEKDEALMAAAQSKVAIAEVTKDRILLMAKRHAESQQTADITVADYKSAVAQFNASKAQLQLAILNLQYTHVLAPTSGWVTNVTVREGDVLTSNQPLFALISDNEFWVDANFKETEIAHIKTGKQAKIKIDMYPGRVFTGVVDSISGGSGTAFSLLPPENATGNWVKVAQRVPVRVRIADVNEKFPLRVGTSANVSIHVNPWS